LKAGSAGFHRLLVLCFALGLIVSLGTKLAGVATAAPTAPIIGFCEFLPDPRSNVSFSCGTSNAGTPAFTGGVIHFNATVSDPEGGNLTVTFYLDYFTRINGSTVVNPWSPVVNVTVPAENNSVPTYARLDWTYDRTNWNYSFGGDSSFYYVRVEVRDNLSEYNPTLGYKQFRVTVNNNTEPYVSGLPSFVSVSPTIRPQNPVIPLAYLNGTIGDWDGDPLTVSWDWGDGTWDVTTTNASTEPQPLNGTHQYPVSIFPLNESPRDVRIPVTVWVDDLVGHNISGASVIEFGIDFDFLPTISVASPVPGSRWKVNESVVLDANAQDREGDSLVFFWDFDNRTDSDGNGDPTNDRDATTNVASHVYAAEGDYNVTFWASDGENKKLCTSPDRLCTTYRSHWAAQTIPILVRVNRAPILGHSNQTALIGAVTTYRIVVLDPDGDSLNVTWAWGDGSANSTNATVGIRGVAETLELFQSHAYDAAGIYNLTVIVSDGEGQVQETKEVFVESLNDPPLLTGITVYLENWTESTNSTFRAGELVRINVTMWDPEGDSLRLEVAWGDGNVTALEVTGAGESCTTTGDNRTVCTFSHEYADTGELFHNYPIVVTLTDGKVWFQRNVTDVNGTVIVGPPIIRPHTKNLTVVVIIANPQVRGGLGPWDWIDYTTFSAVLGLPIALAGRWAWRARKERREE